MGSKGCAPGVARALRFWEMVSSTALRDVRRKSALGRLGMSVSLGGKCHDWEISSPRRAVLSKQKRGVREGCGGVRDMVKPILVGEDVGTAPGGGDAR